MTQIMCQRHKGTQEQKLKERSKSNFQIRNKTRLWVKKKNTRTRDVQNKHENEKNITRLWCKIMFKIGVEHIKGNEGFLIYLYPFKKDSMCASSK
jgi:hypothetical protein